jgi:hypothetical protein
MQRLALHFTNRCAGPFLFEPSRRCASARQARPLPARASPCSCVKLAPLAATKSSSSGRSRQSSMRRVISRAPIGGGATGAPIDVRTGLRRGPIAGVPESRRRSRHSSSAASCSGSTLEGLPPAAAGALRRVIAIVPRGARFATVAMIGAAASLHASADTLCTPAYAQPRPARCAGLDGPVLVNGRVSEPESRPLGASSMQISRPRASASPKWSLSPYSTKACMAGGACGAA